GFDHLDGLIKPVNILPPTRRQRCVAKFCFDITPLAIKEGRPKKTPSIDGVSAARAEDLLISLWGERIARYCAQPNWGQSNGREQSMLRKLVYAGAILLLITNDAAAQSGLGAPESNQSNLSLPPFKRETRRPKKRQTGERLSTKPTMRRSKRYRTRNHPP